MLKRDDKTSDSGFPNVQHHRTTCRVFAAAMPGNPDGKNVCWAYPGNHKTRLLSWTAVVLTGWPQQKLWTLTPRY